MAKTVIINRPNIDVKKRDVSSESYSEAFFVITWYNAKKNPAPKGNKDLISKTSKPGLKIINTPIKPKTIIAHNVLSIFSLKINIDKITTKTGAKEATLWAVVNDKYLKEETKKTVSITDTIDLLNWILIFLVL